MTNRTHIFCTTAFEGFHRWESAPEEVNFLRTPHRHLFHVKFEVQVIHSDRELEFFIVQRHVESAIEAYQLCHLSNDGTNCGSCEMTAAAIIESMRIVLPDGQARWMRCTVSEDGENGAVVEQDAVDHKAVMV